MKLKNKLLPLVGIAATAAVVTPLVTSCKLSKLDIVDITKGYTPTTKASVAGELTQQEATQTYINDIKTNSEIFRQDFLYGVYNKVIKTKNSFLNSPNLWSSYITVANFKVNSLKAGVSNPTFGSTTVAYPGEPTVTYPTVSFEYNVQIEYTYEYIGYMEGTGARSSSDYEVRGYNSRTVTLETNVKYNNVPFFAIAKIDANGGNTYWQVSPLDTYEIYASEDDVSTIHYYNQAYVYQYMEDDWSIDVSASANVKHDYVAEKTNGTVTSTPSYNMTIDSWETLSQFASDDKLDEDRSYDLANYYDMLVSFANFGFESYYLSSVAQKPEIQSNGHMEGFGTISETEADRKASFGAFYLPQTFSGTVKLYSELDTEGKPSGDIVLENQETATPMKLTIAAGTELSNKESGDYSWQYGVNDQLLSWDASVTPTAGNYNFVLPKTVIAEFTLDDTAKTTWPQVVYLNQNTLKLHLEAE